MPHRVKDSDVVKEFIRCMRGNKVDELNNSLRVYGFDQEALESFFLREGEQLLDWSVKIFGNSNALQFLSTNIDNNILREFLQKDSYRCFRDLLHLEIKKEKMNRSSVENKKFFAEKLEVFFKVDCEGVKKILLEWENDREYLDSILSTTQKNLSCKIGFFR